MPQTQMRAPTFSGTVQSEYGNYPISNYLVTVDSRLVVTLQQQGYTLVGDGVTTDQMNATVSGAVASAVAGMLANAPPPSEMPTGTAGSVDKASRGDHVHPRISETFNDVLDGTGAKTLNFGKLYDFPPGVVALSIGANAAVYWDGTWIQDANGKYTGIVLTGRKGQKLPTLSLLLTDVVTKLAGFDPFSTPAAGVAFTCIVIKSSRTS